MEERRRWCKIADTGAYVGISRGLAYRLARSGAWRVARVTPRCIRVDLDSVDEWLARTSTDKRGGW